MLGDIVPFKMIGNLYFVGERAASSHLIDTGEGLILIDTGYERTADIILENMKTLGFDIADVKMIIHSHGHWDHTGATALLLKHAPKAKTYLHTNDIKYIKNSFVPDYSMGEGDVITLGNTSIRCMFTPGHTEGSMSFFFDVEEGGKTYRAAMFGGAGTKQLTKNYMDREDRRVSYHLRALFFESVERLKKEHVDVFVGNHSWQNDTEGKQARLALSDVNPFIDENEWVPFLDGLKTTLEEIIYTESREKFVNYAHRGASEYAPENTLLSFNLGVFMGANGIETDVQLTKDSVAVLFHDDTLMRVTGQEGRISDYTFDELQEFFVTKDNLTDKILKLEDFLRFFSFRDFTFAIELKQTGAEKIVADLIFKYNMQNKVVITSFNLEAVRAMREYAPYLKCGFLTSKTDDMILEELKEYGIDEFCPKADTVDAALVEKWHRMGFRVRAWGVRDEALMRHVYDSLCDGMTVNFPDKLTEYIKKGL